MSDEWHEFVGYATGRRYRLRIEADADNLITSGPIEPHDAEREILNLARQLRERDERIKELESDGPGTPAAILSHLLTELEARVPLGAREHLLSDPIEPKYLAKIDALISRAESAERNASGAMACIGTIRDLLGLPQCNVSDLDYPTHSREIAEGIERKLVEADEAIRKLNAVIEKVQAVTVEYLRPSGLSIISAILQIVEATDGPEQREAQSLPAVRRALDSAPKPTKETP